MTDLSRNDILNIIDAADFYMPVLTSANYMSQAISHSQTPPGLSRVVRVPYPATSQPEVEVEDSHGTNDAACEAAEPGTEETLVLVDPAGIEWPRDTFAGFLLAADHESSQAITGMRDRLDGLPQLRGSAAKAAPSGLRRLFGSPPPESIAAARKLGDTFQRINAEGAFGAFQTAQSLFLAAVDLQNTTGVTLWDVNPMVPPEFVDTARTRVLAAADCRGANFDWLDADELAAIISRVKAWDVDPNSVVNLRNAAEEVLRRLTDERVQLLLGHMPVDALKEATSHRLRFTGLGDIGVHTVKDVLDTPVDALTAVNGIGEATARRMKAAAQSLKAEAAAKHSTRIGAEPSAAAIELVGIVNRFGQVVNRQPEDQARVERLAALARALPPLHDVGAAHGVETPGSATGAWSPGLGQRCWLAFADDTSQPDQGENPPADQRMRRENAVERVRQDVAWAAASPDVFGAAQVVDPGPDVWDDYMAAPARYQSLLADLLRINADHTGFTDADTIAAIRALTLVRDNLRETTFLRGYQMFGAKFAVVRKKTILGDEMGLGKTIQAIAWACHLEAVDPAASHIAVVCPASVVLNWVREIEKFSTLPVVKAHGDAKEAAVAEWETNGGFLVCTYDGARALDLGAADILIVDEAHLIKNPSTRRSTALAALINQVAYALLLTGTPLENRVSEFATLIGYVQPELLNRAHPTMRATAFARAIAPAYLRRNQVDVLDELPEKLEENDIVELNAADVAEYRNAVASGSWMAMRRAAYLAGWASPADEDADAPTPSHNTADAGSVPAKVERILDIVEDAAAADRKVIVFSYFLDVLDVLGAHLGQRVVGTITGAVSAPARQEMVDALGAAPAGSVLLAQITAGGTGLNIQTASVIVLAEPQVKPTIEDQAIARAFRMGQTRKVQVHRIIGADTVDERMLKILAPKRVTFDAYARTSEITVQTPDAVDITETKMAATIIAEERARLGFDPAAPVVTEFGDQPAPAGVGALSTSPGSSKEADDKAAGEEQADIAAPPTSTPPASAPEVPTHD